MRATFAPTLPPPATMRYIRPAPAPVEPVCDRRTHGLDEEGDRGLRGAHRAQSALRVELRAPRVEHAHDDAVDAVALWIT